MSKPTSGRNSCDCSLSIFLPITDWICNKLNVKVSYSCTTNMVTIISSHNKIILTDRAAANSTTPPCNCRNKASCLLEEKCRKNSIVYKVFLIQTRSPIIIIRCGEMEFKARFYKHNQSFNYRRKSNTTELSKAFWLAKDAEKIPHLEWCIAARTALYQPEKRSCSLCLLEKLTILRATVANHYKLWLIVVCLNSQVMKRIAYFGDLNLS